MVRLIQKYKSNVEKELSDICDRILKLLRDHLEGDVQRGRVEGLLQEDEGRLLPLPRGV